MASTTKTTVTSHNPPGFAQSVLKALKIQPTTAKVAFLNLWFSHEGNNSGGSNGQNNPLNVQGSNPVPYNYATPAAGVAATAATIKAYNKPVSQGGLGSIYTVLADPKSTGAQLAAAVETSKWAGGHYGAYNSQGQYVGGSLLKSYLPSVPKGPGVETALGLVGHYATHPGQGVNQTAQAGETAATNAATSAAKAAAPGLADTGKDILYGLAVLGGGITCLVGLILIGADIGLEKFGKTKPAQLGGRAADAFGTRRARSAPRPGPISSQPRRVQKRASFEPESAVRDRKIARSRIKRGAPGSSKLAKGDSIPF